MKSDGGNIGHFEPVRLHKFGHGVRLSLCDLRFQMAENCRLGALEIPCCGGVKGFGKLASEAFRVGKRAGWA